MSQFEFETKEQREAWRVTKPILHTQSCINNSQYWKGVNALDEAASRFDEREKTCEIEPLSEGHARLIIANGNYASQQKLVGNGLLKEGVADSYYITDRGREVLAHLNAMCKVER